MIYVYLNLLQFWWQFLHSLKARIKGAAFLKCIYFLYAAHVLHFFLLIRAILSNYIFGIDARIWLSQWKGLLAFNRNLEADFKAANGCIDWICYVLEFDLSSKLLDEFLAYCDSKSYSILIYPLYDLQIAEKLANRFKILNSFAWVIHFENQVILQVIKTNGKRDLAIKAKFNCIANNISKDLPDSQLITCDKIWHALANCHCKLEMFLNRHWLKDAIDFIEKVYGPELSNTGFKLTRLYLWVILNMNQRLWANSYQDVSYLIVQQFLSLLVRIEYFCNERVVSKDAPQDAVVDL